MCNDILVANVFERKGCEKLLRIGAEINFAPFGIARNISGVERHYACRIFRIIHKVLQFERRIVYLYREYGAACKRETVVSINFNLIAFHA